MIGGRLVTPKDAGLANATFIGDEVRTAIFSSFAPGTRVGTDTLIGQGVSASRDCEAGKYYELNQDITVHDVSRVREPRHL